MDLAREGVDSTEAGADELLGLGVEVVDLTFVGAHDGLAFPEGADDGADFSDESVKDSLLNFSHNCLVFGWLIFGVKELKKLKKLKTNAFVVAVFWFKG